MSGSTPPSVGRPALPDVPGSLGTVTVVGCGLFQGGADPRRRNRNLPGPVRHGFRGPIPPGAPRPGPARRRAPGVSVPLDGAHPPAAEPRSPTHPRTTP
ncbi:hypothetical protein AW27_002580 [Streptomyces sp. PCS3-D2]|uniref:hypothetical protein n=1 Tax=Streptomyces sp. PCS3-D2 TaxID=1460244 RepID=UPI0004497DB1|nr:hypothetical protein [Streptomyces sp. PCS3-D2]WKV70496.1 hypothetical protein AW27_002580 [Streptomyces sp. PCS3-D2]